jgi:hypothetical protein
MHDGNLAPLLARFGHYAGPPSSGNLYRRSAIEAFFPLPEADWKRAADTVPFIASALKGKVATVARELGSYRLHGAASRGVFGNVGRSLANETRIAEQRRDRIMALAAERIGHAVPAQYLALPMQMRLRTLSFVLARAEHPYAGDSRLAILRDAGRSLRQWPGYSIGERAGMFAWIAALLLTPRPLAELIAGANASGALKAKIRGLLGR